MATQALVANWPDWYMPVGYTCLHVVCDFRASSSLSCCVMKPPMYLVVSIIGMVWALMMIVDMLVGHV